MTKRGSGSKRVRETLTADTFRSYMYPRKIFLTCYVSGKKFKIGDRVRVTVELIKRDHSATGHQQLSFKAKDIRAALAEKRPAGLTLWEEYVEVECSCHVGGGIICFFHQHLEESIRQAKECGYEGMLANFVAARHIAYMEGVEDSQPRAERPQLSAEQLSWRDLAKVIEKHKPNMAKQMSLAELTYITRDLNTLLTGVEKVPPPRNCPTCNSPGKHLHPAVQFEGEVQPCSDPWHAPAAPPVLQAEREETNVEERHRILARAFHLKRTDPKTHGLELDLLAFAFAEVERQAEQSAFEKAALLIERSGGMDIDGLAHCVRALGGGKQEKEAK